MDWIMGYVDPLCGDISYSVASMFNSPASYVILDTSTNPIQL